MAEEEMHDDIDEIELKLRNGLVLGKESSVNQPLKYEGHGQKHQLKLQITCSKPSLFL
jgi:hypothetical protein